MKGQVSGAKACPSSCLNGISETSSTNRKRMKGCTIIEFAANVHRSGLNRIGSFTDMKRFITAFNLLLIAASLVIADAGIIRGEDQPAAVWPQWRGPTRDGLVAGSSWPRSISEENLQREWRVELPPSYSGPIVSESAVFVTGTADMKNEVVVALDRKSGKQLWRAEWPGAMLVPFFAWSNGSWIRSTPCFDGESPRRARGTTTRSARRRAATGAKPISTGPRSAR